MVEITAITKLITEGLAPLVGKQQLVIADFNAALKVFLEIGKLLKEDKANFNQNCANILSDRDLAKINIDPYKNYFSFIFLQSFKDRLLNDSVGTPAAKAKMQEYYEDLVLGLNVFFDQPVDVSQFTFEDASSPTYLALTQTFIRDQYNSSLLKEFEKECEVYQDYLETEATKYPDAIEKDTTSSITRLKFKANTPLATLQKEKLDAEEKVIELDAEIQGLRAQLTSIKSEESQLEQNYGLLTKLTELRQTKNTAENEVTRVSMELKQLHSAYDTRLASVKTSRDNAKQAHDDLVNAFDVPYRTANFIYTNDSLKKTALEFELPRVMNEIQNKNDLLSAAENIRMEKEAELAERQTLAEQQLAKKEEAHPNHLAKLQDKATSIRARLENAIEYARVLEQADIDKAEAAKIAEKKQQEIVTTTSSAEERKPVDAEVTQPESAAATPKERWSLFNYVSDALKSTAETTYKLGAAVVDVTTQATLAVVDVGATAVNATAQATLAFINNAPDYSSLPQNKDGLSELIHTIQKELSVANAEIEAWNMQYPDKENQSTDKDIEDAKEAVRLLKDSVEIATLLTAEDQAQKTNLPLIEALRDREAKLRQDLESCTQSMADASATQAMMLKNKEAAKDKITDLQLKATQAEEEYARKEQELAPEYAVITARKAEAQSFMTQASEADTEIASIIDQIIDNNILERAEINQTRKINEVTLQLERQYQEKQSSGSSIVNSIHAKESERPTAAQASETAKKKYEQVKAARTLKDKYDCVSDLRQTAESKDISVDQKVADIKSKIPAVIKILGQDRNPFTKAFLFCMALFTCYTIVSVVYAYNHWNPKGLKVGGTLQNKSTEFAPVPSTCRTDLSAEMPLPLPSLTIQ